MAKLPLAEGVVACLPHLLEEGALRHIAHQAEPLEEVVHRAVREELDRRELE